MNIDFLHLKEKIAMLMSDWTVPGISIGIMDAYGNNKIISLGKRSIEKNKDFDKDTLFPIGCCTKAFTSIALGILADKHILSLDDPVKKHLIDFSLVSQLLTDNVTIKDILCMRTGIHMDDIIYSKSNYSCEDVLNKIKIIQPEIGFRENFLYDIFLYNFLKMIIIKVTSVSWEEFILNEIANPLGIKNITFALKYINFNNYADGYYQNGESLYKENHICNIQSIMPSAGINISMNEILKWMEFLLHRGKYNGKQIISNAKLNDILRPYAFSKAKPAYSELFYQSYALGWFNEPYKGYNLFYHEGNIRGYSSLVSILQDMKIGISVLINKDKCPLTRIILYNVIDSLFGLEQTNWSKRFKREAIVKKAWLSNCINHNEAVEKAVHIREDQFSNVIYGTLKIYRTKQNNLFVKILSAEYSFYSIMDDWYVFNNYDDFLFIKYRELRTSIYVKFAINSKEIEFIKI